MSLRILQAPPSGPRLTFVPLFYSVAGWGLAHAWLVLVNATSRAHFLAAVPAFSLVALVSLRVSADLRSIEKEEGVPSPASRWATARGALLLLFLSAAFGLLVANGSVFVLAMAALLFTFVPLARLPFRTHHVGLPLLITGIGFMCVVLPGYRSIGVMFLPLATWAFWLCACCPLLLRIEQSRRAERDRKAGAVSDRVDVRPATRDA